MSEFIKTFHAGWGDMDFNGHMRNTAYLDKSGDSRMMFFAEHGFAMGELSRIGVGPVIMNDTIDYVRELRLLDEMTVALVLAAMSEDGARFRLKNEFRRAADQKRVALVTSTGGWLSFAERKLVAPPPQLLAALSQMPRDAAFEVLPSLRAK
jgi:acyl-CoA thioester hydrolase